jgi:proline iminopeptidase
VHIALAKPPKGNQQVMTALYPPIEPYDSGMLDVGEGHHIYWEVCGNPNGKPAIVLHGGPGSGCTQWHRQLFSPSAYRVILFDQRNCGRSTPHASIPQIDLTHNTTMHLIDDIERLRNHLNIERWLVFGGSWGSVLALAYAEQYPQHISEYLGFGISLGRYSDLDWLFRGGVANFFPEQWEQLREVLPIWERQRDIVEAYAHLLANPDPAIHQRAADAWCLWESATLAWPPTTTLAKRFTDPRYALAFARIVTHYISHQQFLEDGILLRNAGALTSIPGIIVNGRFDFQSPIGNAWTLQKVWPRIELMIVDEAGHSPAQENIASGLIKATDQFAGIM